MGFTCQGSGKIKVIQGEAKPATPCASPLGLAQTGVSRAITGQTRSTSRQEEGSAAVTSALVAGCPLPVLGDGELMAAYGSTRAAAWGAGAARHAGVGVAGGSTARGQKPSQQNLTNLRFRSRAEDEASGFGASSFPPAL